MTTTTFTSRIKSNSIVSSYNDSTQLIDSIYHVEAYGEEDEYLSFEIMAKTFTEAMNEAEQIAMQEMINISYIQLTNMD